MNGHTTRVGGWALACGLLLAACSEPSGERLRAERVEGARRALAALPDVEVLAFDPASGIITLRSRASGTVTRVELDAPIPAAAAVANAVSPPTAPAPAATLPPPAAAAPPVDAPPTPAPAEPHSEAAAAATATGSEAAPLSPTITRDRAGRVARIEGPGFTVERSATAARERNDISPAPPASRQPEAKPGANRPRLINPVVCGNGERRSVEFVDIVVPGAGVVAERGCVLTLSNVVVRAGGWGLIVNPGAQVRIDSSLVEGQIGAVDIYPGASLSAWATTFRGAFSRPVSPVEFIDRGGNVTDAATAPSR